ncbi:MAG: TRAP transporter large permease [Desulfurispora sp.]|uniref:TRAP transporter large permease n=1 Tax=Desulfurispora sp. TaxID=3014275 RepID=UPI00404A6515
MDVGLLFGLFALLFLLRVPVAVALALAAMATIRLFTDFTLPLVAHRMFASLLSPPLLAIPAFVSAGVVMMHGGISKYIIAALRSWLGHLPGGLAVVTVGACAIFAAISGSSPATAAAIGAIMLPALLESGYPKRYSMGLIAAAGTLGILIPPSVTMVVFGVTAEESIGDLFMGGLLPGLGLATVLIFSAVLYARVRRFPCQPRTSWPERWRSTAKALPGMVLPLLILGTIYLGVVTPTEAAVLSLFYALFVATCIYREMSWAALRQILRESVNISAMIYLVIAAAMVFSMYLTYQQVPQQIIAWISEARLNKYLFFLATNLMFFVMGTFLEAVSITLITLPLLLPIIKALQIDIIQFAVVMTVNMELAMITPPVGLNLYVVSSMAKSRLEEVVRGVWPFILILVGFLILLILWPDLSTYVPRQLMQH